MLRAKDGNHSGLSNLKRTFSAKLDRDSDELDSSEWPATQAKPSMPRATSNTHWAAKTTSAFMKQQAQPKKRDFPWDHMAPPPKKNKTTDKGAFHVLAPGSKPLPAPSSSRPMASSSLNIKQKVSLSREQQRILQMVVEEGKSVFFTGSAGTGKSVLLREIISALKTKYKRPDAVAITASTGMAACNIGGTTIHSFAGIGLATEPAEQLVSKVKKNRKAASRWQRASVLIIDEVSMVDGDLFDKLATVARGLRPKDKDKPFGGIQLIVTGDFFQLPPVSNRGQKVNFAFDATQWPSCIQHTVNLTQVFRQKDTAFIDMLNEMRFGTLSPLSISRFAALSRTPQYPNDGIEPTELFPKRAQVDSANMVRLNRLPGREHKYVAEDGGDADPRERQKMFDNMLVPSSLTLKVGAQVMLIKNKDESLVNGTTGQIVKFAPAGADPSSISYADFDEDDGAMAQEFNSGDHEFPVYKENKPRILQGEESVALKKTNLKSQEEVPWVSWVLHDGRRLAPEPLAREEFKVEQGDQVRARRKQFPIILAWAVSIHKSQGQTLGRVKVDLRDVFEAGQSYVALSRATSIESLQVLNFSASKVRCHPRVVQWAKTLTTLS